METSACLIGSGPHNNQQWPLLTYMDDRASEFHPPLTAITRSRVKNTNVVWGVTKSRTPIHEHRRLCSRFTPFTLERIIPGSWHLFPISWSVYTSSDQSGIICCESERLRIRNRRSENFVSRYLVSGILFWCKRTLPDTLSKCLVSKGHGLLRLHQN